MEPKKQTLTADMEQTFNALTNEFGKFDRSTLNAIPFEGSWTAGQTLEHIIICGDGIPDKNTTITNRSHDEKVQAIKDLFLNFDVKFEADAALRPNAPPHYKKELLKKINDIKTRLKKIADTTNLEELCLDRELPGFGKLTRYEWLCFILFHTQRHTRQIENIVDYIQG